VPCRVQHIDLVIPPATAGSLEVRGLRKVLLSRWLTDQLASLHGDDLSHCGEHVTAVRLHGVELVTSQFR
jgi:hypothetical protein